MIVKAGSRLAAYSRTNKAPKHKQFWACPSPSVLRSGSHSSLLFGDYLGSLVFCCSLFCSIGISIASAVEQDPGEARVRKRLRQLILDRRAVMFSCSRTVSKLINTRKRVKSRFNTTAALSLVLVGHGNKIF